MARAFISRRMANGVASALSLVVLSKAASADAGPSELPAEREAEPLPTEPLPTTRESAETPAKDDWNTLYDGARAKLLAGDFVTAAAIFATLERTAANDVDRAAAHAQRTLADDWTARGVTFGGRADVADVAQAKSTDERSTDEIVSLYVTSTFYGIGSGLVVAALTEPDSVAGAVIPGIALTGGAVGTVMALDRGRGLRYGVAQSIVTGTYIGLEHGIAWTFIHNNLSETRDLRTSVHAALIWGAASLGAVSGGVLGSVLPTTPGRSAWVGSTTLWTGAVIGVLAGVATNDAALRLGAAGAGLTVGTPVGMLTAGPLSPSIGRVRLIDLSCVVGGAVGALLYEAASDTNDRAGASAVGALGLGVGFGTGLIATSWMKSDPLRHDTPTEGTSKTTSTGHAPGEGFMARVHPLVIPTQFGGAMLGAGGSLD